MKPTSDDFAPRRDGWYEHRGTWAEVTTGTVLGNRERRTERWEVVDQAHGIQVTYGHTLWMRIREQSTGQEATIEPRNKTNPVLILTRSPADTQTAPPSPPSDSEAIMRLVTELGATHLAARDEVTGVVTCPDYATGATHSSPAEAGDLLEHMRFAHGIDTEPLERLPFDRRLVEATNLHARAHHPQHRAEVNKGGFPHVHGPEDLSIFTGME